MSDYIQVNSHEEAAVHIASLRARTAELERQVVDMQHRFDALQTPLWKRIVYRLDGWPGRRDLNADKPAWRPWRRWWTS